ncbi:MAG: calcium/sodium antiporter [Cytophagales bacterium]|nr:calcium/sodium antiporter [Cytophagales bacterium]
MGESFYYILLIGGMVVLLGGGELLVRGASKIALKLRMSSLVVGLTIVSFGTSAPELLINIQAALGDLPDLAMGNVVGSNICNLTLVLGVVALILPIKVHDDSIKIDWPVMFFSSVLLFYLIWYDGYVNKGEGIAFLLIIIGYTSFLIIRSRKKIKEKERPDPMSEIEGQKLGFEEKWWVDIVFIVMGCFALFYGAEWLVEGAKHVAADFGISERVIGITIVAFGTSLPEVVTSAIAAFRKNTDMAMGNVIGSNIFNILSVLGITSIIKDIRVHEFILNEDMWVMLGITVLVLPMMATRKRISRFEGAFLLLIYFSYIILTGSGIRPIAGIVDLFN